MKARRELKKRARAVLRRHYLLLVALCLVSSFIGLEYSSAVNLLGIRNGIQVSGVAQTGTTAANGFSGVWRVLVEGDEVNGAVLADNYLMEKQTESEQRLGGWMLGRTRGVLASMLNEVSSGSILVRVYVSIYHVVGARNVATGIFIVLSLLVYLAIQALVFSVYGVIYRRLLLEARTYKRVPMQRAFYLLRLRKWLATASTLFITNVWRLLWWLTIVGGVIKHYSYRMVPYIVAENPSIKATDAVTLSRRMMEGHKWECCKLELSFLLWEMLSPFTFGLVGIFFVNPYQGAVIAEFYVQLRSEAKEKNLPGSELLSDTYLYEKADREQIRLAYPDVPKPEPLPQMEGIRGFFANYFGVVLRVSPEEREYERILEQNIRYERRKQILEGWVYPARLCPCPVKEGGKLRNFRLELHYMRHYTVWSLVMIFFSFSMIGWVWEVMLHLLQTGELVNRGVLHGPWLPIYGAGGVLILLTLYRFRDRKLLQFILSVVLCGMVEYFTSLVMELVNGGIKWWDYSGYFLNLNGRICAEGLIAFGLGGLAMVYILAPLADDLFQRVPAQKLAAVACVLLCLYTVDQAYSIRHPNVGRGITDIEQPPVSVVSDSLATTEIFHS